MTVSNLFGTRITGFLIQISGRGGGMVPPPKGDWGGGGLYRTGGGMARDALATFHECQSSKNDVPKT